MGGTAMTFPAFEIATRQVDVKGIFRYCNVSLGDVYYAEPN